MARDRRLRVTIVQELVPHYRAPLFDALAERVDLTVLADGRAHGGSLVTAPLQQARFRQASHRRLGPFLWQPGAALSPAVREADVLVLNWNIRRLEQVPALLTARRRGIATVLWGHGYSKKERSVFRAIRDGYGRLADATLFYSEPVARAFVERGNDPRRVFVAPNAIDQRPIEAAREPWLERPVDLEAFARRHGLNPAHTVLHVARLEPAKRLGLLIEAFSIVRARLPDARLVLIGGGPEEAPLRSLAGSLGLTSALVFVGPLHAQQEIAPWALNSSVAAYPADIGLSLLHAFGFGLPVVTSDCPMRHNPEIAALQNDVNGRLFQEGSAEDLARVLLEIMTDSALQRRLAAGALRTVRAPDGFTLDRMVEGFVRCLEWAAAARRAG